jgi:hypothetical protein
MATIGDVLANVSDALQKRFIERVTYQFTTITPTLAHIYKEKGFGESLNFDAIFSAAVAGTTPEGYVYATGDFTVNKNVRAYLPWAIYSQPFALTDLEINAINTTRSPEDLCFDFIDRKIKEGLNAIAIQIDTDIFDGYGSSTSDIGSVASTNRIVGLTPGWSNSAGGITNDTGTYAGISRGTYATWKGQYIANSANTVLSPDLIDSLLTKIFVACGRYPNLIVVSPNVARAYRALFTTNSTVSPILNLVQAQSGKLDPMVAFANKGDGFNQNLSYGGIKVVVDPFISETDGTLGKLYALNTDYIGLHTLPYSAPGFQLASNPERSLVHGIDEVENEIEDPEIPVVLKQLPVAGLSSAWALATQVQLAVTRPQANGWMAQIKVS